jgi:bla regulator protein blaR1
MLAMIGYVLLVSLLLGAAALAAEFSARQRGKPRRWIWLASMLASLLLPLIIPNVTVEIPDLIKPASSARSIVLRDVTSVHVPMVVFDLGVPGTDMEPPQLDLMFHRLWWAISLAVLAVLAASGGLLYWRKRRWAPGQLCGTPVLIAPDVGPAVVGLLHPRIVAPSWLLRESPTRQRFVLAHEQSHLDAGDPRLLTFALCLLVAMPWNLPMWWQFHRLRRAIEVDCDARVLRGGSSVAEYCDTLIQVGENQSGYVGVVAAMSESASFLEQRIRIMLLKPGKWAGLTALAMIVASLCVTVFAAQVVPPDPADAQVSVSPDLLARYVGLYQFEPYSVMTVKQDGAQLATELTGFPYVLIYPSSPTTFFAKVIRARMNFDVDAQGHATAIELYQGGQRFVAPRIDAATAQRAMGALAARVSAQQPFPGSEQALLTILDPHADPAKFSANLALARHNQAAEIAAFESDLGPVQSYKFMGVTAQGWDQYVVNRTHGTEQIDFVLGDNGIIFASFRRP